jgi:hypothetical protein
MQIFKENRSGTGGFSPDPPDSNALSGEQLVARWRKLPPALRYRILHHAGEQLRRYHHSGASLLDINLRHSHFNPETREVCLWPPPSSRPHLPLSHFQQLRLLARWHTELEMRLNTREAIQFLSGFMHKDAANYDAIRGALHRIRHYALTEARKLSRRIYQGHLHAGKLGSGGRGSWRSDPSVTPHQLRNALAEAEQSPALQRLKQSEHIQVFRVPLLDQDVVVKRYDAYKARDLAKGWARASRGRQAYAAACTLQELQVETPRPLGFLECLHPDGHPVSYFINTWLPETRTARAFIKPWLHQQPVETRHAVSQQLFSLLNQLYDKGIYHGDTKASNLLVQDESDDAQRRFFWIDLESMQFGIKPMRYHILRNLVQLNGSIGRKLPAEERIAFLHRFYPVYEWARDPKLPALIESKTRTRLLRELNRVCGY